MTSIVFTYNTIIPGVYDINVSAVNILGESLQRNIEGTICQRLIVLITQCFLVNIYTNFVSTTKSTGI